MQKIIEWFDFSEDFSIVHRYRKYLSLLFLAHLLLFLPNLYLFFGDDGIVSRELAKQFTEGFSLLFFLPSSPWLTVIFISSVLCGIFAFFNIYPNISFGVGYLTFISISNRLPATGYGGTQILTIMLFLAMFIRFTPQSKLPWRGLPLRLMQLQFCMVYLFSGLEKVRVPAWYYGEALSHIAYNQMSVWPGKLLLEVPFISFAGNYFTLLLELLFPVLVWTNFPRKMLVLTAAVFHIGILTTLNTSLFPFVMLTNLLLFEGVEQDRQEN